MVVSTDGPVDDLVTMLLLLLLLFSQGGKGNVVDFKVEEEGREDRCPCLVEEGDIAYCSWYQVGRRWTSTTAPHTASSCVAGETSKSRISHEQISRGSIAVN